MSEETYEFQCMRAELLGLEKPSLEEFERNRAERLKQQQEELDAAEAQVSDEIFFKTKNSILDSFETAFRRARRNSE